MPITQITVLDPESKVWVVGISKLGLCYIYSPEDWPFDTAKRPEPGQYNPSQADIKSLIQADRRLLNDLVDLEWEIVSKRTQGFKGVLELFENIEWPRAETYLRLWTLERKLAPKGLSPTLRRKRL